MRLLQKSYPDKLNNLEEMHKLLKIYNVPIFNDEGTETLERMITSSEIESVIKKLPTNQGPGLKSFIGEFY